MSGDFNPNSSLNNSCSGQAAAPGPGPAINGPIPMGKPREACAHPYGLVQPLLTDQYQLGLGRPLNALGAMFTRTYYADWKMLRDVKRRRLVKEHHRDRLRVNCIRKNTILPDEIKEIADREIAAFPRDSCHVRIRDRCAITSRPRAVLRKWRLSRIVWRSVADGGNMSGAQRSTW